MFRRHHPYTPYSAHPYYHPPANSIMRPPRISHSSSYVSPQTPPLAELSQLDRLEREVIDLNKRVNNLSRRLRRLEDHLNIHD